MIQKVLSYIQETYDIQPEYPWASTPDYAVFRHKHNKKWFAVLIPGLLPKCLGLSSEGTVDILNLKCDPKLSGSVKDGRNVFPGYHLNKEHWISAVLSGGLDLEELTVLIDVSYQLTQ